MSPISCKNAENITQLSKLINFYSLDKKNACRLSVTVPSVNDLPPALLSF